MKRNFFSLFVLSLLALYSCTKTVAPADDGDGEEIPKSTAEFQIEESDDFCSTTLYGTFFAGAPMTENEYIKLNLNVTNPGTVYFSTETINGYNFFVHDTIDTPGIHEVHLRGKGMPLEQGNNKFTISKGNANLSFTIPVVQQAVQLEDVPSEIYMKGKFGGENFDITFPGDENDVQSTELNGDSVEVSTFVNPGSGDLFPGYGALTLQKQYLRGMQTATEEDFLAFFNPGSYPIAYDRCGKYSDGIRVTWVDDEGESWTVSKEGNQEGSSYVIVGAEGGHRTDGKYFVKVKAYLTCKLYKSSTATKTLENVEIVSCFVMDND